jgi:L-alanine-DL-glutamate epimerase-like enolase superfamily enzyme
VKVKVGAPGRLAEELAAVVDLRQRLGPAVAVRLDANGTLDQTELDLALPALKQAQIELFEEPGSSTRGSVPLALDESLQGLEESAAEARIVRTGAAAVVLKPTALGGICRCLALAERARRAGAAAVISHCFDGPWAFRAAAALALSLGEGLPHGLAPHAGLAKWPKAAASCIHGGQLEGWSEPGLGLGGGFE